MESNRRSTAVNAAWTSILGNAGMAVLKGVTGIFGHSYALIADAIESTTDVFASVLVLLGIRYASKPADDNHPYGHGRAETLVTFIVVGFLLVSATIIAYESIHNIRTPHEMPRVFTLYVLGGIVLVKEVFYRIIARKSEETKSTSLKADAWHHRSDAITSALAFVGILIAILMGPGYESADDWAALCSSGVIAYNAFLIFRPALGEILDEHLYDDMVAEIRTVSERVEGVIDTEKCFVRKTGMTFLVDLHLTVDGAISVSRGHDIAHAVKDAIRDALPEVADVLIHVEPSGL